MTRRALTVIFVMVLAAGTLAAGFWYDNLYRRSLENDTLRAVDSWGAAMLAVGDAGYMAYSSTSGGNFTTVNRPGSQALYAVSLVSAAEGYVGGAGVLYHSTNIWNWYEVNRPTQIANIRGLSFLDSQNGWACGGNIIARTTDGAGSWSTQTFAGHEFYAIKMHSSSYGLAVDTGGRIVRWDGSGWTQVANYASGLRDVYILDTSRAWAVGESGAIYATTDGGLNWSSQNSQVTTTLNGVFAQDDSTVYAVGNNGLGLYSTNGGTTWSQLGDRYLYNNLMACAGRSVDDGFVAVGELSYITGTSNGHSWNMLQRFGNRLNGIVSGFDHNTIVIAVGEKGLVMRSMNYGDTWGVVRSPIRHELTDIVHLGGGNDYVAVGRNGTVLRSTDSGATWHDASGNLPNKHFFAIDALDANTWFVCGADLSIYRTTNGGSSWTTENTGTPGLNLYDIAMLDINNGWAVGDVAGGYAVVYKKDSGSWSRFSAGLSEANAPLRGVGVVSDTEGWICGDNGNVFYLYLSGTQWRKVTGMGTRNYNSLDFMTPELGWIVSDGGVIYHTTNGGVSYTKQYSPAESDNLNLYGVYFYDDGASGWGWACGEINARLVYGDFSPVEELILEARNCDEGIRLEWAIIGEEPVSYILERDRGDDAWDAVSATPLPGRARGYLDFVEEAGLYRYRITVLEAEGPRRTFGPVEVYRREPAGRFALAQPFPNPVGPGRAVNLVFELPESGSVSLEVYDLAGRRVGVIHEGGLAAGRHSLAWDTTGYPAGVYLIRLGSGGESVVRRISIER